MDISQQQEIEKSLNLLEKDWKLDPLLRDFVLGKITDVSDHTVVRGDVTFHIPHLNETSKYLLWKCLWPDCHNCCERQGRLPLTSDDLITIGNGLKYTKTSEFIKKETVLATYRPEQGTTMTTINLKRREDETELQDGTHIPCRFLDGDGACSMHPARPGVCYIYPFSTWTQNDKGMARIHAGYQLTGDCPGFYFADDINQMQQEFENYSTIIRDYNLAYARTDREMLSCTSM